MTGWREREAELRELVASGMTDAAIADHYGLLDPSAISNARRALGIKTTQRPMFPTPEPEPGPQPISIYTDEHGRTIRVYPARYAVGMQPFTVRPGRRRS
ncbi:hypothetical protein J8F10_09055 [Gemmata sp. G18]|uniref:Uncharacterized protein n=1 Tax=Gemmata palustris TaxID=2822762 RepID=A0ABS5BNX2_9BACT|nr:hypothetical protein [Gemmata palustris]MBP3955428.1 hypothetical protein [Gemmata palustris]